MRVHVSVKAFKKPDSMANNPAAKIFIPALPTSAYAAKRSDMDAYTLLAE